MPLPLPNLDDRTYKDLVAEAIAMIPRYAPSWTNHNASDPGITVVELLAYFTELLIFRLDRIGRENQVSFLRLLAGSEGVNEQELQNCPLDEIERRLRQAVLALRQRQRAVTDDDYEYLAKAAALRICGSYRAIRVCYVAGKNLELGGVERDIDRAGHVSLVVVTDREKIPVSYPRLLQYVRNELEPSRLLTTRLHVVGACYIWLGVSLDIQPRADSSWATVKQAVLDRLNRDFDPVGGSGPNQAGWEFGRNLYLSNIIAAVEHVDGVDYIENAMMRRLALTADQLMSDEAVIGVQIGVSSSVGIDTRIGARLSDSGRLIPDGAGKIAGIMLKPYELLKIVIRDQDIRILGRVDVPVEGG